jgi:hypothetical protein
LLRDVLGKGKIKMIKLNIEEYCKICSEFEVVQESFKTYDCLNNIYVEHNLTCAHREKCRAIKRHLEKKI